MPTLLYEYRTEREYRHRIVSNSILYLRPILIRSVSRKRPFSAGDRRPTRASYTVDRELFRLSDPDSHIQSKQGVDSTGCASRTNAQSKTFYESIALLIPSQQHTRPHAATRYYSILKQRLCGVSWCFSSLQVSSVYHVYHTMADGSRRRGIDGIFQATATLAVAFAAFG